VRSFVSLKIILPLRAHAGRGLAESLKSLIFQNMGQMISFFERSEIYVDMPCLG
jgi:hypothetical protein